MGALKHLCCSVTLGLSVVGPVPAAFSQTHPEQGPLRMFAVCAGRLSALVEHQWMVDGPASEQTARSRDAMLALVDAVVQPEAALRTMQWRIDAKVAQAGLLARAHFAGDQTAEKRSAHLLQECADLIGQS
jgi:hypothetical protein